MTLRKWVLPAAVASAFVVTAISGLLQTAGHFQAMGGDGVSYLDLGEAILSGQWAALGGFWSPIYGVLAAAAERIGAKAGLPPFAGVHVFNLLVFLLDLYLFDSLVRSLIARESRQDDAKPAIDGHMAAAMRLFAFGLFALVVATINPVWVVSPDLLVAAVLLSVFRQTVLAVEDGWTTGRSVAIGVLLGAGYWIKAIVFPLALFFLAVLFWLTKRSQLALRSALITTGVWLLIVMPLVGAVSARLGRITFGDSGRLNFIWHVNGLPVRLWNGGPEGHGAPGHPLRQVHSDPDIYEFAAVMPEATYPLWYDPSYFYEGAKARLDPVKLGRTVWGNLRSLRQMLLNRWMLPFLLTAVAGLAALRRGWFHPPERLLLMLTCSFSFLLLIPVHLESRYVTAQALVLLTLPSLVAGLGASSEPRRRMMASVMAAIGVFGLAASCYLAISSRRTYTTRTVTASLQSAGVRAGDRICAISDAANVAVAPKAARARIVAQMPLSEYRHVMERARGLPSSAIEAFRSAGCAVVLADLRRGDPAIPGWLEVVDSPMRILPLRSPEEGQPGGVAR